MKKQKKQIKMIIDDQGGAIINILKKEISPWVKDDDEDNINRQMESGYLRGADVDASYHRRNGRKRCDTRNNDNL